MVSFELARALIHQGIRNQQHHFISAKRAIHLPAIREPMYDLPHQDFIERLINLGGTPPEVLQQKELMDLFIPILRSDFSLSETFVYQGEQKLQCDATLLYGTEDEDIPEQDVLAWQELIHHPVEAHAFDGGHFFINPKTIIFYFI